ncbi:hypothetical protein EVC26_016 [Rhizobium phage RHph_I72]|nr:hypothetical protein EVC26_016 [Rhizobium phage RHph_I72]
MFIREFQARVLTWMERAFSPGTVKNRRERAFRFLEESLELFQSLDCTQEEAQALVEYVFGRPKGETYQEVGGVSLTLAALCSAAGIDFSNAAHDELERVNSPEVLEKIRAKRANRLVPGDYSCEHTRVLDPDPQNPGGTICTKCGEVLPF